MGVRSNLLQKLNRFVRPRNVRSDLGTPRRRHERRIDLRNEPNPARSVRRDSSDVPFDLSLSLIHI